MMNSFYLCDMNLIHYDARKYNRYTGVAICHKTLDTAATNITFLLSLMIQ